MNDRGILGVASRSSARLMVGLVLALQASMIRAQPAEPQTYPYGGHMMWGDGWFGAPRHDGHFPPHSSPGRTPLDILKERYARGEIDKEEFEERRRVLGD